LQRGTNNVSMHIRKVWEHLYHQRLNCGVQEKHVYLQLLVGLRVCQMLFCCRENALTHPLRWILIQTKKANRLKHKSLKQQRLESIIMQTRKTRKIQPFVCGIPKIQVFLARCIHTTTHHTHIHTLTCSATLTATHPATHSATHPATHSATHPATHSHTQPPTHAPSHIHPPTTTTTTNTCMFPLYATHLP